MIPVRTRSSNFVYRGPTPEIGDAWVVRRPEERAVYLTLKPSDEERAAIAAGGLIVLGIYHMEPIPPTSLEVTTEPELSPIAAAMRDDAYQKLRAISYGPNSIPPGCWTVSSDVWHALNEHDALDPNSGGVPTLFGRPLLQLEDAESGTIEYAVADPRHESGEARLA